MWELTTQSVPSWKLRRHVLWHLSYYLKEIENLLNTNKGSTLFREIKMCFLLLMYICKKHSCVSNQFIRFIPWVFLVVAIFPKWNVPSQNGQPCCSMRKLCLRWTNYWARLQVVFPASVPDPLQTIQIRGIDNFWSVFKFIEALHVISSVLCKTTWAPGFTQKKIIISCIVSLVTIFEGVRALLFSLWSLVMVFMKIN